VATAVEARKLLRLGLEEAALRQPFKAHLDTRRWAVCHEWNWLN
jgi:hypothetical protein